MNELVSHWVDYSIIALVVLWSCYVVLRRFMPKTSFKWQQALALGLNQKGFTRLSGWLMPKAAQSGCSAGCSDCSVDSTAKSTDVLATPCASSDRKILQNQSAAHTLPNARAEEQPVHWR